MSRTAIDALALDLAALTLTVEGGAPLRVTSVEGAEALSTLFDLRVVVETDEPLASGHVVGERATLRLAHRGRARDVHGIVRALELGDAPEQGAGPDAKRFLVTLAPAAYVLALREDCRVFQGRTAPEIVAAVLIAAGFGEADYRVVLRDDYRAREHCIQYRESDWAFLTRLLESEGIHCFFEHARDREVLVFTDTEAAHARLAEPATLPFRPGGGGGAQHERVSRFRHVEELRAGAVTLKGHSFKAPRAALEHHAAVDARTMTFDAPPEFDAPERGARLARLHLERESAARRAAHAVSDCLALSPGTVFELREHAADELNRAWLVTSVEHRLAVHGDARAVSYENRIICAPVGAPLRPKRAAPRPSVGVQTAVVVGPPGQDVHCDELGRVKVRFHWEHGGGDDAHASWVRVGQAWAGPGYGALFVPRVGNEVLVDFECGDVDRPIIVGSVYNGANLPPASLPEERGVAVLRASSTPGGDGVSELRMDAQRGKEHVRLVAHRDLTVRVGGDKAEAVAASERLFVGGDRGRAVEGSESVAVQKDRSLRVRGAQVIGVGGDEARAVGGDADVAIGGDRATEVGGKSTEIIGEDLVLRVGGSVSESVTGDARENVLGERAIAAGSLKLEVDEGARADVAGDHHERAGGARRISAGEIVELVCGEATITAAKDGTITLVGKRVRVKVAGHVEVEGDKLSVKSRGAVNVSAAGAVKVRGRGVNLN
ncbi:MAG TPA: type VI secretion system tip protein TssI/VgrG [Byssovorax sp.]|jgi:type VI secretion system secreted protein VgrG